MSKLPKEHQFLDLSDYGRSLAKIIANSVKNTWITPIHITLLFGVSGLLAIYFILNEKYIIATGFLILKSVLDAADGELARVNQSPSHVGRYLDSIIDIILNLFILLSISYISQAHLALTLFAFVCMQLQGTLYNYYYVILRSKINGSDGTSRVFEVEAPKAFKNENQRSVNVMFRIFYVLYAAFDYSIFRLDPEAPNVKNFPNWFMTLVSCYGLGFQLLIIGIMMSLGCINYIIPFLIYYSVFLFILTLIRKQSIR